MDSSDQDPPPPAESNNCSSSRGTASSGSGRVAMSVYNNIYAGYESPAPRFESRWGPWSFCGCSSPQKPCQSPVGGERSILTDEDEDGEDEEEDDDDDDDDEIVDAEEEKEDEEDREKELRDSPQNDVDVSLEHAFRGAGLRNLGNTCFLNAVLQCLVHTYPIRQGLPKIEHNILCFMDGFCIICALRNLMNRSFPQLDEIAHYRIVANLKYFSPNFVRYHQEDAHEFLQCLLNKLEMYPIPSPHPCSGTPSDNLVKQVFGGSLVSGLRCGKCNHISSMSEELIDFSLEIDEVNTLEDALDSFTKPEKIEDIKLSCERCNGIASMEKQFMVDKAPVVASFHLKRFKNDGTTVEKIRKHVDYPLTLNLHPYTVRHPEHHAGLIYDLYGVIVHLGYCLNSGHYFCFVRSSPSVWHEFDDSTVTRVSESHVLSQEAYILFYAKREASWFINGNEVQGLCTPIISPNSVLDKCNQSGESDLSTESSLKCDVQVIRHGADNVATCQPALSGPQLVNTDLAEKIGHGKVPELLPSDESDDKNEFSMDDPSFNFDMLLSAEEKENRSWVADNNDSSINFEGLKDECNNTSKEVADKSGSLLECDSQPNISTCQELVDFTRKDISSTSISNSADSSAIPSVGKASNMTIKNLVSPGGDLTKQPSSLASSSSSRENIEVEKRVLRKRPAKKLPESQRKRQISEVLKRTNMPMPMITAHKFPACSNVTQAKRIRKAMCPNKKNKKSLVSPTTKSEPCC